MQCFFFYSNRWTQAFRTHIGEMHHRLKSGDLQVKISNATSRALTGDTSLSVNFFLIQSRYFMNEFLFPQKKSSLKGKNVTVVLDALPRLNVNDISSIEIINYFIEITQQQLNERNQVKEDLENNTVLVLPKINK